MCLFQVRIEASKLGDLENAFSKEFIYVYILGVIPTKPSFTTVTVRGPYSIYIIYYALSM